AGGNTDRTHLVGNGVSMRILRRMSEQGIHTLHERLRNGMLDLFGLRIDFVERKAHDLDEKEFQQAMSAHQASSHRLTSFSEFDAMIRSVAHIASLSKPLKELSHGRIAQLACRLECLQ